MPISGAEMGFDRALKIYGLGSQGVYGDRADDKPNGKEPGFWDIVGKIKWDAWGKYKGTPMDVAQKANNKLMHELLIEKGYGHIIPDPTRPGPNYYDDCIKFNWVDALVKNHKEKVGGDGYTASAEEMAAILKLTDHAQKL